MKVVYIKNNKYKNFKLSKIKGFKFKPRKKNINNLVLINKELIKEVLTIKIKKDIIKATKAIKLMLKSDITEISDCNMMIDELTRIAYNIEKKYMKYFTEFEYFELIKDIYYLNMEIMSKKKIIEGEV